MGSEAERGDKFLTMKAVAEATGLSATTIRYYDQQFEGYLSIVRGKGGKRQFTEKCVEQLSGIRKLLKEDGLSMKQAKAVILEGAEAPAQAPAAKSGKAKKSKAAKPKAAPAKAEPAPEGGDLAARVAELETQFESMKQIQARILSMLDTLTRKL